MTTTSTEARPASALPPALRRGLGRVDRRIRAAGLLRGLGTVALVAALGAAGGMALDVAWPLPEWARWAIWGAWLLAIGAAALAAVAGPLVRRVGWTDLAAVAEAGHPDMGERLTSSVALLAGRAHGSPALIAALADDAAIRSRGLDLARAVGFGPAARRAALGAAALALVAAPGLVRPDPFATLLKRFLAPWSDLDRVGRFVLDVRPGDRVVAIGSDLPVSATVRPRFGRAEAPDEAWLEWADAQGVSNRVRMAAESVEPASTRSFSVTLPRVPGSLAYRVASGSAQSRRHRITAVEPPAVASLSATVEPPAYTRLPAATTTDPARIEAWEDSRITLRVAANKPVRAVGVEWPVSPTQAGSDSRVEPTASSRFLAMTPSADGKAWSATLDAEASGTFAFQLKDEYDLRNRPEPPRRLVVRPDRPPTVALGGSGDPKEARADDVLLVDVAARDDLAVASIELHYAIERAGSEGPGEPGQVPAPLPGLGTTSARGEVALSLKPLGVRPGDVVSYRVRVADNRPAPRGPNVVWSSGRILKVVDKADPLADRRDALERGDLQAKLDAIKKAAAENRKEAEALRYAADAAQRGNGRWDQDRARALSSREAAARDVVDKLQLLARDFAESGQFAPLARPARQIAEVEAEGGRERLDHARRADDPAVRLDDLKQADNRLAATQARLDDLQRRFDALARQDDDRRRLRVLAERQEELAARAAELARRGDRAGLEEIQREQEAIRRETEELARRSPELRAEALDAQAREAKTLADRARDLARRQREEARRTADPSGRVAALKALAEAQREVEDDARRLAMQVDRALEENGRGRADVDALARAVEPIERGDIAQGRERLEAGEDVLRRLSRDLEDVGDDPKALARRLARRQETLNQQVAEVVREATDVMTPRERAELAERIKPLAARQDAIARLAGAIPVDEPQKNAAREATKAASRTADDLRAIRTDRVEPEGDEPRAKERRAQELLNRNRQLHRTEQHGRETRDALNRLADALPDVNQRRGRVHERLADARRKAEEVARELERHLRETAPQPGRSPESAAEDLARRVAPLAQKQEEVAAQLAALDVDRRAEPQSDRAARRAQALADQLDAIRDAAPPPSAPGETQPAADWHVLGPFDLNVAPPFAVGGPVDLKAIHDARRKVHATWRGLRSGDRGLIDLGAIYSTEGGQCAFGYAEVVSPAKGVGRLVVGSDDTLTVWVNGRLVYDFQGARSFDFEQGRADVALEPGVNRVVIRCGNHSADWKYAVALKPPPSGPLAKALDRMQALRDAAPPAQVASRASLDRLEQKLQGREPADDRAAELAAEAAELRSRAADPRAQGPDEKARDAEDAKRIATALRNLDVPDAPSPRGEAIRQAERAARALEDPKAGEAKEATRSAAEAADALARQLTDAAPSRPKPAEDAPRAEVDPKAGPRARAEALAERQRDLAAQMDAVREQAGREPDKEAARARAAEALAPLAERQRALAEEARSIPDPRPNDEGKRQQIENRRNDVRLAQWHAAEAMAQRDPERAAQAAREAGEALGRMARALPEQAGPPASTPADPELGLAPAQAEEARDLARRERHIRERLQGLLGERVAPQERLREEATELGRAMADLRDRSRETGPRGQGPANAAADLMQNHAPTAMGQGAEHLAQGRPEPARDAQRRAAELVEHAAEQADDLAAALRADRPAEALAGEPDPADADRQAGLASALSAQRQAGRELAQAQAGDPAQGPPAAQAASGSMHQAAQGLRAASQARRGRSSSPPSSSMADAPPPDGTPRSSSRDPKGGPAGKAAADLSELQALIKAKTGRSWGELPGHLRTEILQMSQGRYRDDYARLIQLYFREIAADKEARP
jgi:hypothetical protein